MDAKITLSFDAEVIEKAKKYAQRQNISLSRLTEFLLRKITSDNFYSIEDLPVADWVNMVAEGKAEYCVKPKTRKQSKKEFFGSKK